MTRCTLLAALAATLLVAATGCPTPDARSRRSSKPALPTRPLAEISFAGPKQGPTVADIVTTADRSVVVSFVDSGQGVKARYVALDAASRVHWTRLHDCPTKGEPLRLFTAPGVLVCKGERGISALSLATGTPVWSWKASGRLYITKVVGNRVVTSEDNKRLVVLDATSGKVLRSFALDGSPFEALGQTPRGLLAYVLRMKGGRPEALVAQLLPAADRPQKAPAPLAPLWSIPFSRASSYEVDAVGSVVIARPETGVIAAYRADTGKLVWRAPAGSLVRTRAAKSGLLASGALDDGTPFVGLIDPATGLLRWQQRWPEGPAPSFLGEDQGYLFAGSRAAWRLYRAADGVLVAGGAISKRTVVGVAGDHATVFSDVDGARRIQVVALPQQKLPSVAALPAPPARPTWMQAGTRLLYELRIKGRETQRFELFVRARRPHLVYGWRADDGRRGIRVIPREVLAQSTQHSDLYGVGEGHQTIKTTSIWVSRRVYAALAKQGAIDWYDVSAAQRAKLRREGRTLYRATLRPWVGQDRPIDLPALVARGDRGTGRYWIAEHADYPLLLRAVRKDFEAHLTAVIPPRPGTGVDISALKWPPPCPAKGSRACLEQARLLERRGAVDAAFLLASHVAARTGRRSRESSVWSAAQAMLTRLRIREFLRWPSLAERLEVACKRSPAACLALAEVYDGVDAPKAVAILERLCRKKRDPRACLGLGDIYVQGRGSVSADPKRAAELFGGLCRRNQMLGCIALGALRAQGSGVDKDAASAAKLWQKACDRRAYLGCVALGSVYIRGAGVERDNKKAVALLGRACTGREAQACYLLGVLHLRGGVATKDPKEAAAMFNKACGDGHGQSCLLLGHLYREGQGVSKDPARARDLFRRACDSRVRRACVWLSQR